jgi:hypothetical protein
MPRQIRQRRKRFKKKLPDAVQEVKSAYPNAEVEVWAMDEHRIGLKPIIRRLWRRKGQRPIVRVQHRYKWMYVYGFVCPSSGQTFWVSANKSWVNLIAYYNRRFQISHYKRAAITRK